MLNKTRHLLIMMSLVTPTVFADGTTEFCLEGEFNLGYRLQHYRTTDGWVPTTWCVVTDDKTGRVLFSMTGKSNPDIEGDWSVAYFPPDTVRIVNRDSPPDVEFQATDNAEEARSVRRIDPRRLAEEHQDGPIDDVRLWMGEGRVNMAAVDAILPIQGAHKVTWSWNWENEDRPRLIVSTNKQMQQIFRGTGRWRDIPDDEVEAIWAVTPGADKIEVPGGRWPARISMKLINLTDDVYLARGTRTGFQHLVVDTADGLIVADAPASWLEFHQIPPKRFLPDLPIDGISEKFIEYLGSEFKDRPIHAVALTHFHDDHVGGAPAFAEAGAAVYAPGETAKFLSDAFARRELPGDEKAKAEFRVRPVDKPVTLGGKDNRVRFVPLGENPHSFEMLGVWAVDRGYFFVSDIHVPRDDKPAPRPARAKTECWFAGWAVKNLPVDVNVVNSHSQVVTPVSRLAEYLDSDACGG